jgi:hypothetical protein
MKNIIKVLDENNVENLCEVGFGDEFLNTAS